MELGEGRAPGLEERLRRDHQDVHAGWPSGRAGGVTKPTCYTTPRLFGPSQAIADVRSFHPDAAAHARTALIWILKIVVSGGLLYVLLWRVDIARLWTLARAASIPWLLVALALYLVMILISAWRWTLLLGAQHVQVPFGTLVQLVPGGDVFQQLSPSNIGGDVVRIRDTAPHAGSKTTATTIVLVDRGIGLLGLIFVAAVGATITARGSEHIGPIGPSVLWGLLAGALVVAIPAMLFPHGVAAMLRPLSAIHQEWVEVRLERLTTALAKFRDAQGRAPHGFIASVLVQAILVGFYASIAQALHVPAPVEHIAVVVPLSFIVQMCRSRSTGLACARRRSATTSRGSASRSRRRSRCRSSARRSSCSSRCLARSSISPAAAPCRRRHPGKSPGGPYMNVICRNAPR